MFNIDDYWINTLISSRCSENIIQVLINFTKGKYQSNVRLMCAITKLEKSFLRKNIVAFILQK